MIESGIRTVGVENGAKGNYQSVRLVFGPHYFVELHRERDEDVTFVLGAAHHGFTANTSEANGELEKFIYEIRSAHPQNLVD